MVERDFGGESPIGRVMFIGRDVVPSEIVGVVEDVRQFGLDRKAEPQFFVDFRQRPGNSLLFPVGAYYAVRTDGDPQGLIAPLRAMVRELDDEAALFNVAPMNDLVASTISRPRLYAVLLGVFAAVGVTLALIGVYGVMAYAVTQRTREIGIRVSLGAKRNDVLGLVLRKSFILTTIGVGIGMMGAAAVTRSLEGMLFGLAPLDLGTFAMTAVLFIAIAALASYMPARRAARVDPLIALRCD